MSINQSGVLRYVESRPDLQPRQARGQASASSALPSRDVRFLQDSVAILMRSHSIEPWVDDRTNGHSVRRGDVELKGACRNRHWESRMRNTYLGGREGGTWPASMSICF